MLRTWLIYGFFCLLMAACATTKPEGLPTGITTECPDGTRRVLDCRKAFEQFARTVRFDLGVVKSYAVGVGVGAQNLITLDSVTGDLLAHQRQMCIDYNNCILGREEYKEEMRYLRRAQLKIRQAAYWASVGSGSGEEYDEYEEPPFPPGVSYEEDEDFEDESRYAVLDELDGLSDELKEQVASDGGKGVASKDASENSARPVQLKYSISARRKSTQASATDRVVEMELYPGMELGSGDQFKVRFTPDNDGYVYVLNFDSSGKSQVIFPHPDISLSNEVTANETYEVPPDPHEWYFLDDVAGQETLYLVAVPFPIPNLDKLISELRDASSEIHTRVQTARLRGALEGLTRGVGGIVRVEEQAGPSGGKTLSHTQTYAGDEPSSGTYGMTAIRMEYTHR